MEIFARKTEAVVTVISIDDSYDSDADRGEEIFLFFTSYDTSMRVTLAS